MIDIMGVQQFLKPSNSHFVSGIRSLMETLLQEADLKTLTTKLHAEAFDWFNDGRNLFSLDISCLCVDLLLATYLRGDYPFERMLEEFLTIGRMAFKYLAVQTLMKIAFLQGNGKLEGTVQEVTSQLSLPALV